MRLLLDTHALLWWLDGDRRLPGRVRVVLGEPTNEVLVSAASVWGITTKARLGKLPGAADVGRGRACVHRVAGLRGATHHGAPRAAGGGPARTASRSLRPHADRPGAGRGRARREQRVDLRRLRSHAPLVNALPRLSHQAAGSRCAVLPCLALGVQDLADLSRGLGQGRSLRGRGEQRERFLAVGPVLR
jgi:hypothetical protein